MCLKRKHLCAPNTYPMNTAKQFLSISTMAKTRGAHATSPSTRNPRPRVSPARDSTSEAPQALAIPLSEGGVPSNPPQRRYETRRPPTTPRPSTSRPKRSVHRPPAKKAKVSSQEPHLHLHNLIRLL
ncbi:hypothetical protein CK203_112620 [Vitis vinifera]|uniref:Uncharacterized protein n=1 Tax=Vitis vinifera TaxID=29760 RepID=A0A438CE51_VITVI|nr:hypothetical protein CK203_112620 [Vitis vinifera]